MPMLSLLCDSMADMVIRMIIRTYSELITLPTFEERFRYLKLDGQVGAETFGFDRYLNQIFYQTDPEWKEVRDFVIVRDNGCDLAIDGYDIHDRIYVHHMNPISINDILDRTSYLLNPDFLITTRHSTHNAIHYGDELLLMSLPVERTKNDTCPWRH